VTLKGRTKKRTFSIDKRDCQLTTSLGYEQASRGFFEDHQIAKYHEIDPNKTAHNRDRKTW